MRYEELLDKAYSELPEKLKQESRFQVPEITAVIQGRITVFQNFGEVCKAINRDPKMVAKYFLGEMGTGGDYDAQRLTMKGQFRAQQLQDKLNAFLESYVICPDCKRPDTRIITEKRVSFLKCEACGARHPLGAIRHALEEKKDEKRLSIGDELTLQITMTGKKGDGMAKFGGYIIFVNGAREGQKVRIKINGIHNTTAFADTLQVL